MRDFWENGCRRNLINGRSDKTTAQKRKSNLLSDLPRCGRAFLLVRPPCGPDRCRADRPRPVGRSSPTVPVQTRRAGEGRVTKRAGSVLCARRLRLPRLRCNCGSCVCACVCVVAMNTGSRTSGDAACTSTSATAVGFNFKKSFPEHECIDCVGYTGRWRVCGLTLHARLDINKAVESCEENEVLRHAQATIDDEDELNDRTEASDLALHACRKLFFPFIAQLVQVTEGPSALSAVDGIVPSKDGAYRVQLRTINGVLGAVSHDTDAHELPDPPRPVRDPAPQVPKVSANMVRVVKKVAFGMAIVSVGGKQHFLKQVYSGVVRQEFIREATVLSQLPLHDRVVTLVGLVVLPDGNVDGMLLELIDGVTLEAWRPPQGEVVDPTLKRRWLAQLKEGLAHVHDNHQVWGDAKAANVLIDKRGDAHLIDFGGGYTPGWVPPNKCETHEGDHLGMMKIAEFVQNMH